MEKKIVVIGPSKVGKTALVASLAQAGGQMGLQLRSEGGVISVQPKNADTQALFGKVIELILDGYLPFQGSRDLISYLISLGYTLPSKSNWKRILGIQEKEHALVSFPDAPGGALFPGDDDEVDDVVMGQYQTSLVDRLAEASGLIICIDSSILEANGDKRVQKELRRVAISFARWLPNIFSQTVQENPKGRLSLKKVCFVLTKADLWAKKHTFGSQSESAVKNRDAYEHAKEILGQLFFNTIRNYFSEDVEFGFCMSSVYGFHEGDAHPFFENPERDSSGDIPKIDDWIPYNVIEPFLFLINSPVPSDVQVLCWDEVGG